MLANLTMPTLLQINVTANRGSTGEIAEAIGREALSRGWESYMAYGRYAGPSDSELIRIGCSFSTLTHYASQRLFDNEGLCSTRATRRLIRQIERLKPDVVQLHNLHDHYLNYRLLFEYLNSSGIRVVWTMHDFWAVTGHCMHFFGADCRRYVDGCRSCPMKDVFPRSLIDRSARNYNLKKSLFASSENLLIVAVSPWVAETLSGSFLKDKPLTVIGNGIDIQTFRPTVDADVDEMLKDRFVILGVSAQWRYGKGIEYYRRLAEMLGNDEVLVLVGHMDSKIAKSLPENVVATGMVTDARKLAALYTRADVLAALSPAETFGLSVAEALACGTPAVVFDNTALPQFVTSGTGYVVEDRNVASAYEAIEKIKQNGRGSYSQSCIEMARRKFDIDTCAGSYVSLYERIIGRRG